MTSSSQIDQLLNQFFKTSIKTATAIDPNYTRLWEELRRLHAAGGKRLRPRLVLMSYEAFGGDDVNAIAPIAAAQELIHFSMLIHDDIIDRDITR
jgi:geranylgeranyl diphosphate synthase type II